MITIVNWLVIWCFSAKVLWWILMLNLGFSVCKLLINFGLFIYYFRRKAPIKLTYDWPKFDIFVVHVLFANLSLNHESLIIYTSFQKLGNTLKARLQYIRLNSRSSCDQPLKEYIIPVMKIFNKLYIFWDINIWIKV